MANQKDVQQSEAHSQTPPTPQHPTPTAQQASEKVGDQYEPVGQLYKKVDAAKAKGDLGNYPPNRERRPANLLDGPNLDTAKVEGGGRGIMTSAGELDEATVVRNGVGGVGVVHMLADKEALAAQARSVPPVSGSSTHAQAGAGEHKTTEHKAVEHKV